MSFPLATLVFASVLTVIGLVQTAALVIPTAALARDSGGGSSGSGGSSGGGSGGASSGSSGSDGSGSRSSGGSDSGNQAGGNSSSGNGGHVGDDGAGGGQAASYGGNHHRDGPDRGNAVSGRDQDYARDAVLRGVAVPLVKVIPTVRARVAGEVLDVKMRRLVSGILVYDVTVLSSMGEYRSIVVDAKRNRIIESGQR